MWWFYMFIKNKATDLIEKKLVKIVSGREDTLRKIALFLWEVWEFCRLVPLLKLIGKHVFILMSFNSNAKELEQQLCSVHCRQCFSFFRIRDAEMSWAMFPPFFELWGKEQPLRSKSLVQAFSSGWIWIYIRNRAVTENSVVTTGLSQEEKLAERGLPNTRTKLEKWWWIRMWMAIPKP